MNDLALRDSTHRAFCTFRAGAQLYGIDVASLREISTNTAITPVPPAPAVVRGLANLRSRILLVLDLRAMLGMPPLNETTSDSRLIVLKPIIAEDVGLLVDSGGNIVSAPIETIESVKQSLPATTAMNESSDDVQPIVVGVCKLEHELLMIIDATRLSSDVAQVMQKK